MKQHFNALNAHQATQRIVKDFVNPRAWFLIAKFQTQKMIEFVRIVRMVSYLLQIKIIVSHSVLLGREKLGKSLFRIQKTEMLEKNELKLFVRIAH